jgi:hypothetical protein
LNLNLYSYARLYSWNISLKLRIPSRTKRELASSFYQLKIGYGYIRSYLYRINRSDSSTCRYRSRETTEHLLLACPKKGDSRKKLKQNLENIKLFLRTLLYTKLGIEKALGFIETTRFATRK